MEQEDFFLLNAVADVVIADIDMLYMDMCQQQPLGWLNSK
jgi:hypothetical protein